MAKRITDSSDFSDISSDLMDTDSLEGDTEQTVTDMDKHYIQFAINSDLIEKVIDEEKGFSDKKFRDELLNILRKEAALSIQCNSKIEDLDTTGEKMLDEFNQKIRTIRGNVRKTSKKTSKKKKCDINEAQLFANREELLTYIACRLMTIKTKKPIPDEEINLNFD